MDMIEEVQLYYIMFMSYFYILNIIMTACANRQLKDRNRKVKYEIESMSIRHCR